ncbi:MAG: CcmD family protein, partial [Candidatus Binatia bacterium]
GRDGSRSQSAAFRAGGLMGAWGFVFLAYGIVWGVIVGYWLLLKRRYRQAEAEIVRLKSLEASSNDVQK